MHLVGLTIEKRKIRTSHVTERKKNAREVIESDT